MILLPRLRHAKPDRYDIEEPFFNMRGALIIAGMKKQLIFTCLDPLQQRTPSTIIQENA